MSLVEQNVRAAVDAVEGQPAEVKAAVGAAAATAAIPSPAPADAGMLWKIFVAGLVAILLIALGGIIYTVADANDQTGPDVIVTVFSSVLTGLIGLFVKAPTR
jgi:hypothetical protein